MNLSNTSTHEDQTIREAEAGIDTISNLLSIIERLDNLLNEKIEEIKALRDRLEELGDYST